MQVIPKDPAMRLSYVNMKLRDFYHSLEEFCQEEDVSREELEKSLAEIDYRYDGGLNQFI